MTPAPTRWGLRGDPVLWQMMTDRVSNHPLPTDETALRQIFLSCFKDLTDHDLDNAPDHLRVAATDRANGGMSRGHISGTFWRDQAWPLILSRFDATQG